MSSFEDSVALGNTVPRLCLHEAKLFSADATGGLVGDSSSWVVL